ncbi:hypothetical protein BCD67_11330 [Oscillatoriales cyanobacterium USR001]|nr:hypothetical protein BCD67_11330 [Oscillatoriales cyanobacterium USR001]
MTADILTVIWKEFRELLQRENWRGIAISLVIPVIVFGIMLPLSLGYIWVDSSISVFFWVYLPLMRVLAPAVDAFAGERERHTLETLLATPMSDLAILLGKITSIVCYVWIMTLIPILVALGTINLVYGRGRLLLYPVPVLVSGAVLAILATTFYTSIYTLFALRANTVKQAFEQLGLATTIIVYLPLLLLPVLLPQLPVEWIRALMKTNTTAAFLTVVVVLIILNVGLLWLVSKRFARSRLILD